MILVKKLPDCKKCKEKYKYIKCKIKGEDWWYKECRVKKADGIWYPLIFTNQTI